MTRKATPQEIAKLRNEVQVASTAHTLEILHLCSAVGRPELATDFLRRNYAVPLVRKKLAMLGHAKPVDTSQIEAEWAAAFAAARAGGPIVRDMA